MSKIIIYDNKNILIAELEKTETKREIEELQGYQMKHKIIHTIHTATFKQYEIMNSNKPLRKWLRKIEKIFKDTGGKNEQK